MRGLNIYRLMLRSWLWMLYRENTSRHLVELSSIHSKTVRRTMMCTKNLWSSCLSGLDCL